MILRKASQADAETVMQYVAPVGEKTTYVDRALAAVMPFIDPSAARAA
jgi:hypothetical protein